MQKFGSIFMPRITLQGELSCPYQRTDNAYPRYLDTVINDVKNEVDCEVKCTFYENFVCRSFAYYSSARQCFVSGDDTGEGEREFLICLNGILFAVSLRFIRNKGRISQNRS